MGNVFLLLITLPVVERIDSSAELDTVNFMLFSVFTIVFVGDAKVVNF